MEAASTPADAAAADYPARLDIPYTEPLNRFLPLVKWLLAIPHYIMLAILYFAAWFGLIGAFFALLFTRKFPRGMFDIVLVSQRWMVRGYAYAAFMTTRYPPFVWG